MLDSFIKIISNYFLFMYNINKKIDYISYLNILTI